jgi:hypothetical protein
VLILVGWLVKMAHSVIDEVLMGKKSSDLELFGSVWPGGNARTGLTRLEISYFGVVWLCISWYWVLMVSYLKGSLER